MLALLHPVMPPDTVGLVGELRSIRTGPDTHAEVWPIASTARKRTNCSPWSVSVRAAPAIGALQVEPSSEVAYW